MSGYRKVGKKNDSDGPDEFLEEMIRGPKKRKISIYPPLSIVENKKRIIRQDEDDEIEQLSPISTAEHIKRKQANKKPECPSCDNLLPVVKELVTSMNEFVKKRQLYDSVRVQPYCVDPKAGSHMRVGDDNRYPPIEGKEGDEEKELYICCYGARDCFPEYSWYYLNTNHVFLSREEAEDHFRTCSIVIDKKNYVSDPFGGIMGQNVISWTQIESGQYRTIDGQWHSFPFVNRELMSQYKSQYLSRVRERGIKVPIKEQSADKLKEEPTEENKSKEESDVATTTLGQIAGVLTQISKDDILVVLVLKINKLYNYDNIIIIRVLNSRLPCVYRMQV